MVMDQVMPTALERALHLADAIEKFPLHKCSPSDDPDEQWAYLTGFIDLVRPFIAAVNVRRPGCLRDAGAVGSQSGAHFVRV